MKKQLLTLFFGALSSVAFGQYYYVFYDNSGTNPGNLNQDLEYPVGGGISPGWSNLLTGPQGSPAWSAVQTIPFAFEFNGVPVSSYKVSSTGILTFTVAAGTAPTDDNQSLPSASIPDNSIVIWGIKGPNQGDNILTKVFGTAPNRQLWIHFSSYTCTDLTDGWFYGSIVLEEGSNAIYLVDQRSQSVVGGNPTAAKAKLTMGIQINSTTAVQVNGSPNVANLSGNDPSPVDNVFYTFSPGVQNGKDLTFSTLNIPKTLKINTDADVQGSVRNLGSEAITSFDLYYTADGGPAVKHEVTGVNIAPNGGTYVFNHGSKFQGTTGGTTLNLVVWTENINGAADEDPSNDTAKASVYMNMGVNAPKTVMVEEGTGAWCIHCPDAHGYLDNIRKANPNNVVAVLHHNSDGMTNPQSDIVNAAFATGYPNGYIDRILFPGQTAVGQSRGSWAGHVATALNRTVPVKVKIINKEWDSITRKISFDVEAEFVDYYAGSLRIGAMILENHIRGVGNQFDQSIASTYTGNPSHVYYGKKNPMVGYFHPRVCINIPSGAWGTENSIPETMQPGQKYTQTYTYTLPGETTVNIPSSAEFFPTGIVEGRNKPDDIILVGFVAEWNASSANKRPLLNSAEEKLTPGKFTSLRDPEAMISEQSVYPNPLSDLGTINFDINSDQPLRITMLNTLGQEVKMIHNGNFASGSHSVYFDVNGLENGVYFIQVKGSNISYTHKIVVQK